MKLSKQVVKTLGGVCRKLDTAVRDTFRTIAYELSDSYLSEVGNTFDVDDESIEAVVEYAAETATWRTTTAAKVRKSELRAVIKSAPFLKSATQTFIDSYYDGTEREGEKGPFSKEHMLKLARMIPDYETADDAAWDAIAHFHVKDKHVNRQKSQEEKMIDAAKSLRSHCKGTAMLAAFDAFLKDYRIYGKVIKG